jgi:hypothetical protein
VECKQGIIVNKVRVKELDLPLCGVHLINTVICRIILNPRAIKHSIYYDIPY